MYFHSQFPQDHNLDLVHVSVFLLLFFLNSNPTSIMIFIIFDSFVCTSFIQPVQRIQLKADPGSVVQGNSFSCCASVKPPALRQLCPQQWFKSNTVLTHSLLWPQLFLSLLFGFVSFLDNLRTFCLPWTDWVALYNKTTLIKGLRIVCNSFFN